MRRGPLTALVVAGILPLLAVEACRSPDNGVAPGGAGVPAAGALPVGGAGQVPLIDVGDPQAVAAAPSIGPAEVKVLASPRGVVVPVLERGDHGWKVSTPCGREAIVPGGTPVQQVAVVIDPGHGGYDPGAVGPNGLRESALNLAVSLEAKAVLEREGVSVVLTRSDDHGMNLANRAKLAVALGAKVFVSVHHNAAATATSSVPGSEAYYQHDSEDSKRLAGLLYEDMVDALSAFPVRWVSIGAGATWRSRARDGDDYYAMVRLPKPVPATLVELAYLSNPAEAALLARPETVGVEGEAVARGILRFLRTDEPGTGFTPGGQMAPRPRPRGGGGGVGEDPCDDPQL
ncbi:MAG: N-acetylmuramoyl-L-alanine amidase family protein [Acidimicrobiales bacterium]